jgi:SulP family sulfate permease
MLAGGSGTGEVCGMGDADVVIPTVLLASSIATMIVGATFLLLGKKRLTDIVGYIPANVVSGFLSCIGWKVIKKAIEVASPVEYGLKLKYVIPGKFPLFSWEDVWIYQMPAIPIGCLLYYLKRNHIGKPTVYFPFFIAVPTIIFYIIVLAQGLSLDEVREMGWLFPEQSANTFTAHWEEMYGGLFGGRIEWTALPSAIPSWFVMVIIVNIDNMLKLASTEASLGIDFDYNREMRVGGRVTLATGLLVGGPAYSQTKFNVLNYAMTHSTTVVLPTLVCAGFNGALFFSGMPVLNYLPRFVSSSLLYFSAVGFLIENLVDARHKFNKVGFGSVWGIFIVNVIAG